MPTANEFIRDALLLLGVIDPVEAPEAEHYQLGLRVLNRWISDKSTERPTVFTESRVVQNITANDNTITIGPGGNINRARPEFLPDFFFIPDSADPYEVPLHRYRQDEWEAIIDKAATSTYPNGVYLDMALVGGLSTLHLYPVPTAASAQLVLYIPDELTEFADGTTSYSFPKGYPRWIVAGLAIDLHPYYRRTTPVHPQVQKMHDDALSNIAARNFKPVEASFDATLPGVRGGKYNIYTG